jgi:uncharacterized OB-fold protein
MPEQVLEALHVLEYPYTRSTGPVIGRFLAGLRDRRIEGIRASDGRVLVPPVEYDPQTAEELHEFVEVGTSGVVTTWAWVAEPRQNNPLDRPFAWALIRLDGADTAMLHAVDAQEANMKTGMRVQARWRSERVGHITDLECFEPEDGAAPAAGPSASGEPVTMFTQPIRLEYNYTPGAGRSRFLRGLAEGKILGERCSRCGKVYVGGGSGACPRDGIPTEEVVELPPTGTVTTFCVVNLPFAGQTIEIPYVSAAILLDGADIPLLHLIQEVQASDVRMGMRVQAEWADERKPSMDTIKYFKPTGEPDVAIGDVLKRMHSA